MRVAAGGGGGSGRRRRQEAVGGGQLPFVVGQKTACNLTWTLTGEATALKLHTRITLKPIKNAHSKVSGRRQMSMLGHAASYP
jgi:hypothetical protein